MTGWQVVRFLISNEILNTKMLLQKKQIRIIET